jgi:hypothetical protein
VFFNVGHFYPSLIFQGKSRCHPSESSHVRGSTQVSSRRDSKCLSRVDVTNCGKHSSLFRCGKSYCRKMFYSTGPWLDMLPGENASAYRASKVLVLPLSNSFQSANPRHPLEDSNFLNQSHLGKSHKIEEETSDKGSSARDKCYKSFFAVISVFFTMTNFLQSGIYPIKLNSRIFIISQSVCPWQAFSA